MATIYDIAVGAAFNIVTAVAFLLLFAVLRLQPVNDRVYFPKWYLKGTRASPASAGATVAAAKYINLDMRSYLKFLSWMPAALKMPDDELIQHAGLDSVIYLRIYLTGYVPTLQQLSLLRSLPPLVVICRLLFSYQSFFSFFTKCDVQSGHRFRHIYILQTCFPYNYFQLQ